MLSINSKSYTCSDTLKIGFKNTFIRENIIKAIKVKNIQNMRFDKNIKKQIIKKYLSLVFQFLLNDKSITRYVDKIVKTHWNNQIFISDLSITILIMGIKTVSKALKNHPQSKKYKCQYLYFLKLKKIFKSLISIFFGMYESILFMRKKEEIYIKGRTKNSNKYQLKSNKNEK